MNKNRGVTMLCNTHDLKIIKASDRIVWIRDGQVQRVEAPEDGELNREEIEKRL